jgi:hypothetical protein
LVTFFSLLQHRIDDVTLAYVPQDAHVAKGAKQITAQKTGSTYRLAQPVSVSEEVAHVHVAQCVLHNIRVFRVIVQGVGHHVA